MAQPSAAGGIGQIGTSGSRNIAADRQEHPANRIAAGLHAAGHERDGSIAGGGTDRAHDASASAGAAFSEIPDSGTSINGDGNIPGTPLPVVDAIPTGSGNGGPAVPVTPDAGRMATPAAAVLVPSNNDPDAQTATRVAAADANGPDGHPGYLTVADGALFIMPGAGTSAPIWNDGTIELTAGSAAPTGRIDGTGTILVDSGFEDPVDLAAVSEQGPIPGASQHIRFNGPDASLYLAGGGNNPATPILVENFGPTNTLSVFGIVESTQVLETTDGDLLELTEIVGGVHGYATTQYVQFDRHYAVEDLAFNTSAVSTGAFDRGYTNITLQTTTPCFCPGTLIATPDGERAVETLQIGDAVSTAEGSQLVLWIGRRSYNARFAAGRDAVMPIRIRAGALGYALPKRDLLVSPRHAMLVQGVLVPAGLLINNRSVVRETVAGDIDYLHVELDNHALLLAEGALTESFVNNNSRAMFQNASEYAELYPDRPDRPADWCVPRVEQGEHLLRAQRYVDALSGLLPRHAPASLRGHVDGTADGRVRGWAWCPEHPHAPVLLDILVDGTAVSRVLADRYRADLADAGIGAGCHGFEATVPDGTGLVEVRRARDGLLLAG